MKGMVHDKAALVTGGGSGIGRKTAELLAEEGARVPFCDLDDEAGQETLHHIAESGGDSDFFCVDVSDETQTEAMVDRCPPPF